MVPIFLSKYYEEDTLIGQKLMSPNEELRKCCQWQQQWKPGRTQTKLSHIIPHCLPAWACQLSLGIQSTCSCTPSDAGHWLEGTQQSGFYGGDPQQYQWSVQSQRKCLQPEGNYSKELKEALSVLMLCPPVFKFTPGSSTLLGCPRCTVIYRSDCRYLPYSIHFSEFMPFSSQENGQNMKILEVHHFRTTQKWLPTVNRCTKHYTERASLQQLTSLPMQ